MRRTILVIGAAGGVGLEVVRLLSKTHRVIGSVRDEAQASAVRAEVPAIAEVIGLDLSDNEQLSRRLQALAEDATDLGGVVVCAAVCPNGPVETASVEVLRNTLEVNLISHVTIFQRCMPALRRTQGRLIFTSSYSGQVGLPFTGLYVASKFALEGIADVMRREVSKFGVEIILIEPGGMKTQMVTRQIAVLKMAFAALGPVELQLYGDLYRQFATLADRSFPGATPPAEAARAIAIALRARKPKTRYAVGVDAKQLLAMNAVRTDRAMDKICLDIFAAVDRTA